MNRTHTPKAPCKSAAYMAALLTLGTVCAYGQAALPAAAPAEPVSASEAEALTQKKAAEAVKKAETEAKAEAKAMGQDEIIQLSPFVVTESDSQGYEASNVMSGSRLNTKLDDIAASVSVVTKQQLMDFAAVDINDIFAMEAGTEGTRTYTANSNDGKADVDVVSNSPHTANRVRGLGAANIAIGNFATTGSIPIDTYNVQGVEISRGANSSIFGVGEASGTVNLIPSSANLNRETSGVGVSVSSYGTTRFTADFNRPILKGMLALRVNFLNEDKGFVRKPSFDKTKRWNLHVQAKPFKYTTLRVSYEHYQQNYSRPNSVTAKDYMSLWESVGRPWYDARTSTAGFDGTNTTTYPLSSLLYTTAGSDLVRPTMMIDKGEVRYTMPSIWYDPAAKTTANPSGVRVLPYFSIDGRYFNVPFAYSGNSATGVGIGFDGVPASTNKDFYDYTKVNLAALNRGYKTANLARAELEQFFINTKRHMLALQAGLFSERVMDISHNYVGNGGDGVAAVVRPDINKYLANGEVNPYYGAPYMSAIGPQVYTNPLRNENGRVNLAYQLDMSQNKGWTKWLGRQRVLGYAEHTEKSWAPRSLRYHSQIDPTSIDATLLNPGYNTTTKQFTYTPWNSMLNGRNNNSAMLQMRYYVGDNQGGNVDYATASPNLDNGVPFMHWGSKAGAPGVNAWTNTKMKLGMPYFALGSQQMRTITRGYVYQGYFWKDRILPLYGERTDEQRTRDNIPEPVGLSDERGWLFDESYLREYEGNPWLVMNKATGAVVNKGKTRTKGIVVKPFTWLSLRYNQSNSFKPDTYAIDYYGTPLANPNGTTRDYGFSLNLLRDKLYLRVNRFESEIVDARNNGINAVANRITNMDFDPDPARNDSKMDVEDWLITEYAKVDNVTDMTTATAEQLAGWQKKAHENMGLSSTLISDLRFYTRAMTSDSISRGYEVELTYNPTRYWTMKVTGNQMEAINKNLSRTWLQYRNERLEYWKTLKSPYTDPVTGTNELYWTKTFSGPITPRDYFTGTVDAPMKLNYALEGKPVPQNRKYRANLMTNLRLSGLTKNKVLKNLNVGGRLSWEDKASIGFGPGAADADGVIRQYDANTVYYDKSRFYMDLFAGYDLRLAKDRVRCRIQLNVKNALESGRLQAFTVRPDGTPTRFRIIDPREYLLSVNFDL